MTNTTTDKPAAKRTKATVKPLPHKTYTVRGQKRILFTLGRGHNCKLMDVPAALFDLAITGVTTPDSYVVETGLLPRAENDQLKALLADYLEQAEAHQAVPMTIFASTISINAYAAA